MNFYKVLYKAQNDKLYSSLHTSKHSIEYSNITYAPKDTRLFVFSDLEEACLFRKSERLVIYRVKTENPIIPISIIRYTYLNMIDDYELKNFWRTNWKSYFVTQPTEHVYVCDSVELLEQIHV